MSIGIIPGFKLVGAMKLKSSPSNAEFKNEWSNISIFLANLHGEDGDTFTFVYKGLTFLYVSKHIRIRSNVLLISHSFICFRFYIFINVFMVVFLLNNVIYVFLLLCLYILIVCICIFIVPAGTLRLP